MKTISWLSSMTGKSMKVMMTIALVALLAACSDDSVNLTGPDADAAGKKPDATTNTVAYLDVNGDGLVHQFTIGTPRGAKDPSHLLLQFTACDGSYLSETYISGITVNGIPYLDYKTSTGSGTGCNTGNSEPFIKLESLPVSKTLVVVVTLDEQKPAAFASIIVKSGTECNREFVYATDFDCDACSEKETAWAAGFKYPNDNPGRNSWATFTTYQTESAVEIYAGQTYLAGSVTFGEVDVDGKVKISITLADGFELSGSAESVKIQGYSSEPTGNPSPGQFANKGNVLEVTVDAAAYYGIHLDVLRTVPCE